MKYLSWLGLPILLAVGCSSSNSAGVDGDVLDGASDASLNRDASDAGNLDVSVMRDAALSDASQADAALDAGAIDAGFEDGGQSDAGPNPDGGLANPFTLPTPSGSQGFGCSTTTSADGNVVAVGDCTVGRVAIFRRTNGVWDNGLVLSPAAGTSELYGTALALSDDGTTLAVGDTNGGADNNNNGSGEGIVRVYQANGSAWNESEVVRPVGAYSFGFSVALSADGSVLAVGDSNFDNGASVSSEGSGAAFIYRRSAPGVWGAATNFLSTSLSTDLGYSVALSDDGSVLAVGDREDNSKGAVFVHRWNGSAWSAAETLPQPNGAGSFGYSIALSADGNTLLAGDTYGTPSTDGSAHVFSYAAGSWTETIRLDRPSNSYGFGARVALSADGNVVYIGDGGADGEQGQVTRFVREAGVWNSGTLLERPAGLIYFGRGLSCDAAGSLAVVGSMMSSRAHVFRF